LNGTATKGTNEIKSYEWAVKTTENGVTPVFTSTATAVTKVTGIKKAGTYVFELKVKDTTGVEGTATATVVVEGYQVTYDEVVEFVSLGTFATPTINFSPSNLPTGVTYKLTDNRPTPNTWNSTSGFTGIVNASTYNSLSDTNVTFTQTFYLNGTEIKGNGSKRIVIINVDDFPSEIFIAKVSDTGSVTLTLSKTITEILPPPITKTVTVSFPAFTVSPTFSFTPTYTPDGGWGEFSEADITYILTDDAVPSSTWNSTTGYEVSATPYPLSSVTPLNFTQTFKMGDTTLVTQVIRAGVLSVAGTKRFVAMTTLNDDGSTTSGITPITLTLTKQ